MGMPTQWRRWLHFHCHPVEQKIPKHKRLVDWYRKMLDLAVRDSVVIEYKVNIVEF